MRRGPPCEGERSCRASSPELGSRFLQLRFKIVKIVASRIASLPSLFSESSGVQIHVLQHIGSSCVSHFWVSVSCVLRSAACAMAGRLFSSPDTRGHHREEPLTTEKHPHLKQRRLTDYTCKQETTDAEAHVSSRAMAFATSPIPAQRLMWHFRRETPTKG